MRRAQRARAEASCGRSRARSLESPDFHFLRVIFVSNLVTAGVHPRVAQALARHAEVETTMAVYADLTALDLRGAVERLGVTPPARREVAGA